MRLKLDLRSCVALAALVLIALSAMPAAAQFPGGFVTKSYDSINRPRLTASQIQSFLPAGRGKFRFPAPYNSDGIRITIPADCGGGDCVDYIGYSYWKNINNHQNSDTMYIVLGLNRARGASEGPTLFTYNKVTDAVSKVGALFDPSTKWSWAPPNGWYFSATMPTKLYINYWRDPTLYRYDVVTRTFQLVFDVASRANIVGSNRYITQIHSSDDDKAHSFTVADSTDTPLGCAVYREDTDSFQFFPKVGTYDECHIDMTGRWLNIHQGVPDLDNYVIDLQTNTQKVILNQNGRLGHLDMGEGYMVGNSGGVPLPQATLVYKFPLASTTYPVGPTVFYNVNWGTSLVNHVSHQNRKAGVAPEKQYACGSNLDTDPSRENEIACFRLDTSYDALIVAPSMASMAAAGGGCDYCKYPKGNIDITGQYFIWTSNMYGNRLDAFIAKVPSQLLTGVAPPDTSSPSISAVSAPLVASSSATITWSTNENSDSQVEYGVTTAYGSTTSINASMVTSHSQGLGGLAASTQYHYRVKSRDSSGNLATSGNFSFTTPAAVDTTAPVISGIATSSLASTSATIVWSTNEGSDSQVEYGTSTAYGSSTTLDANMVTSHTRSLTGLLASTLYHYRVKSRDAAGNLSVSQDFSFTTSGAAGDMLPPTVVLTAPAPGAQVKGKIKIAATASDNVRVIGVQFQLDGNNLGAEDTAPAYSIVWNTVNVAPGYHTLTAVARDEAGNRTTSAPVTVLIGTVPADTTAPAISAVAASSITAAGAVVTWSTNENSDTQVEYGLTTSYGTTTPVNSALATAHSQTLAGLAAQTLYHYRVKSRDAAGNLAVSGDFTFTTLSTRQNVTWTSLVNATATGNSLQKTGGCDGCTDGGAVSTQQISNGGYVEFTASETNTNRVIGLSNGNTGTSRAEIAFALQMWHVPQVANLEVREFGNYRTATSYVTGDVFRIAVESGVVKYYKNGVLFYTSSQVPVYPLIVDTSLWSAGGTITNAVISSSP